MLVSGSGANGANGGANGNVNGNGTFVNGTGAARLVGKEISAPVFDAEATKKMLPVRMRAAGKPILVPSQVRRSSPYPLRAFPDGTFSWIGIV